MQRDFALEEITLKEFNRICEQFDIKPHLPQIMSNEKSRKKFRILNLAEYSSLGELFREIDDKFQVPCYIWAPQLLRMGEAEKQTRQKLKEYQDWITQEEPAISKIVIALSISGSRHGYAQDNFRFDKINGIWTLRHFHIRDRNFDLYTFQGINSRLVKMESESFSGIYNKDTNQ